MKTKIKIRGLDCAACAVELEELLQKIKGVNSCAVSFLTQQVDVELDGEETLEKVKRTIENFEEVSIENETSETERVIKVANLHCVACALDLQDEIKKIKGVEEVQVDFLTQTIRLTATDDGARKAVKKANRFEKVRVLNADEVVEEKKDGGEWIKIGASAVLFLLGVLFSHFVPWKKANVCAYIAFALAYLAVGLPVLISTLKSVVKGRVFDENFLMTVASIGAACIGEYAEGVAVMLLFVLGETLQKTAVSSSRRSLTSLLKLKSESARIVENGEEKLVRPEEVKVGDKLRVLLGEKVPVDGIVQKGTAFLDTKSLTGEPEPKTYELGHEILSGCVSLGAPFEMIAVRESGDSAVDRILELVENSTAKKAKSEKFITKFAKIYTPVVCLSALIVAFLLPLFQSLILGGGYGNYFLKAVQTALNFLVISCPCALVISVPLTYFCGIGVAALQGVLIKGATCLDEAAKIRVAAFDKTGTLTKGLFSISEILPENGVKKDDLLLYASSLERYSIHPLKTAFDGERTVDCTAVEEVAGKGISGKIHGEIFYIGSAEFLKEKGVAVKTADCLGVALYVGKGKEFLGVLSLQDELRAEAKETVSLLRKEGVKEFVMLTGDGAERANVVKSEVGLDEAYCSLLPEEKFAVAEKLKAHGGLLYIGDGVNDAPVMTTANVAASMGTLSSAAAVEASDFVLIGDDLRSVVKGIKVAKKTKRIVRENVCFSIGCKLAFLVLSFLSVGGKSLLPVWGAVFSDVGVMLLAVMNALRVRIYKKNGRRKRI